MKALLGLSVLASTAAAEPNTVSLELPGLRERGLILDYERDLPERRISVDAGIVMRASAGGDYGSRTFGIGGEVRYWFKRRAIWTNRPRGSAVGWYGGGRIDISRTSLSMDDMFLGAERQFGVSWLFGYRFAPWRGLEIRPYTGFTIRREWNAGDRVEPWTRGGIVLGFALGWSF